MRIILPVVAGLAVVWTAAQVLLSWRRPELGLRGGSLQPCGARPNCVCSQTATAPHGISPLIFEGDGRSALLELKRLVTSQSGTELIAETDDYLRFECSTPLMRYVDDLEFALDATRNVVHVRSASRVGYSDLGANRKRVENIREQFTVAQSGKTRGGDVR